MKILHHWGVPFLAEWNGGNVSGNAGTNGIVPAFDVMQLEMIYNALILLKAGWSIRARAKTTLDAEGELTFIIIASDY